MHDSSASGHEEEDLAKSSGKLLGVQKTNILGIKGDQRTETALKKSFERSQDGAFVLALSKNRKKRKVLENTDINRETHLCDVRMLPRPFLPPSSSPFLSPSFSFFFQ